MTWVKLDDALFRHPKVSQVQPISRLLFVASLCHASDTLSDGVINARDLPLLHHQTGATPKHVEQLVKAGLWVRQGETDYLIPDYLEYNPSRVKVLAEREAARKRKASQRDRQRDTPPMSRPMSRRESHPPPTPTPKTIRTDYENNAGHNDVEPFAAKPPRDALKAAVRPKGGAQ